MICKSALVSALLSVAAFGSVSAEQYAMRGSTPSFLSHSRQLQTGTAAGITVDGITTDWTAADFYKDMYEAGKEDKVVAAKAFTRMDCTKRTLCILVQATGSFIFSESEAWFKDYTAGSSTISPVSPGIKFAYNAKKQPIAWEGCFALPTAAKGTDIQIHANFGETSGSCTRTASTGKIGLKSTIDYNKCYGGTSTPNPDCKQVARLDGTNAPRNGGSGMYTSSPITFTNQKTTSVDFSVSQLWKTSGSVQSIAVMYTSSSNKTMSCPTTTACTEKTATYTAFCVNGLADVAIFVKDSTFTGLPDISGDIPDACSLPNVTMSNTAMFAFTIPCVRTNTDFCVENIICDDQCPTDPLKTQPGICGCGIPDIDADGDLIPDCQDMCPNDREKTLPGLCGCSVSDMDTDSDGTPDCTDLCKTDGNKTVPGVCGCGHPDMDSDKDGVMDCKDGCPKDAGKTAPGTCGCGTPDTDSDGDGVPDCNDCCKNDPNKVTPGLCGCGVSDVDTDKDGTPDCSDACKDDPKKTTPGVCGCGIDDKDTDGDGVPDCTDSCPTDPKKTNMTGPCGCGAVDTDTDGDGTPDCNDQCKDDPTKVVPGTCGCGVPDKDTDGDGVMDCNDFCKEDPKKTDPGQCGCGADDTDSDGDGTADCIDNQCPLDPNKLEPGKCGCGSPETDSDGDGTPDCHDQCKDDKTKTVPGICGCGASEMDTDEDGTPDCNDGCDEDPTKTTPGECGCGSPDVDTDGDGVYDCKDQCQDDKDKTEPGTCGCGTPDVDTDGDGVFDCKDECPNDKEKTVPGECGCGEMDVDTDEDGALDCEDECPMDGGKTTPGECGCGASDDDSDGDGVEDCHDLCPENPGKTEPGVCGCDKMDEDTDEDGTLDCLDACPEDPLKTVPGQCGCGKSDVDTDGNGIADCNEPTTPRDTTLPPGTPAPSLSPTPTNHTGGGYGDPHLKTWTGKVYDFHGECDLVLVQSVLSNGENLDLHIRTEMREDWSFISATALRIGEDVLEIGSKGMYWLNDVAGATLPATVGGFPVNLIHYGIRRHKFEVDLGSMGKVVVKVFSDFLAVEVENASSEGFGMSAGLMGTFDEGRLVGRNGDVFENHNAFGLNWQVRDTEPQLFHEAVGPQWPQLCHMPEVKADSRRRLGESTITFEQASAACANWSEESRESCIYDIMATGDLSMANAGL